MQGFTLETCASYHCPTCRLCLLWRNHSICFCLHPTRRAIWTHFLLGPSHHVYLDKASVNIEATEYATPLGNVQVDTALCKSLLEQSNAFTYNNKAHDSEHCLEVELPFLQYHFKKVVSIVPIIIATQKLSILQEIARVLQPYMNERNLFVISSDFSHYPAYLDAKGWMDLLRMPSWRARRKHL